MKEAPGSPATARGIHASFPPPAATASNRIERRQQLDGAGPISHLYQEEKNGGGGTEWGLQHGEERGSQDKRFRPTGIDPVTTR